MRQISCAADAKFIIKVDAEGIELPLLSRLHETGRLDHASAAMYEYHSPSDRDALERLMVEAGLSFVEGRMSTLTTGVQKWMRLPLNPC